MRRATWLTLWIGWFAAWGLVAVGHAQPAPTSGVRLDAGRFTVVATAADARLARTLLDAAQARDTFPGLPRPTARVLIAIAGSPQQFRSWVGPHAPEWGAAIAIPVEQRLIMQGRFAGSEAGDPRIVLRHELAHLALHEFLGRLPPRWFDEGYASVSAGEWTRDQLFETSLGMVWRSLPTVEDLDEGFQRGTMEATWHYALAHRVVAELETLGGGVGMAPFLSYWRDTGSFEKALRQAYGLTGEAFDKHWRRETRRRYGALALVTDVSVVVGLFSLILAPIFVSKRRRDRQRLEAMRVADARQEADAKESALQALLDQPEAARTGEPKAAEA
ncbi:MAG: hypothetical protein RLZZ621_1615 [Gemmatimonadota bacterium]|jgi:hypothetical protein